MKSISVIALLLMLLCTSVDALDVLTGKWQLKISQGDSNISREIYHILCPAGTPGEGARFDLWFDQNGLPTGYALFPDEQGEYRFWYPLYEDGDSLYILLLEEKITDQLFQGDAYKIPTGEHVGAASATLISSEIPEIMLQVCN